mmetsp:Transcript_96431/g.269844  ORF Transcript_96431/g.269844 Transcript_96431/m.269844 type:complete len:250 (-) Transcript_96431:4-753(-)
MHRLRLRPRHRLRRLRASRRTRRSAVHPTGSGRRGGPLAQKRRLHARGHSFRAPDRRLAAFFWREGHDAADVVLQAQVRGRSRGHPLGQRPGLAGRRPLEKGRPAGGARGRFLHAVAGADEPALRRRGTPLPVADDLHRALQVRLRRPDPRRQQRRLGALVAEASSVRRAASGEGEDVLDVPNAVGLHGLRLGARGGARRPLAIPTHGRGRRGHRDAAGVPASGEARRTPRGGRAGLVCCRRLARPALP